MEGRPLLRREAYVTRSRVGSISPGATGDGKVAVCIITSCPGGSTPNKRWKSWIWAKVEPKLAQADNIRNALTLVSRGEAKFGIVYATDAKADPKKSGLGREE